MFHIYKGTKIPPVVKESAVDAVETFNFRDDDMLIATYPKSGTHWMNELVQLLLHGGDPNKLGHSHRRTPMEITDVINVGRMDFAKAAVELVEGDPSPRVLMTHLRPHHLPPQTWSKKIPIIYVLRNPMDLFLSLFEFYCGFTLPDGKPYMTKDNFDDTLRTFIAGEVAFDGWCDHVIQYEDVMQRNDNIMFVTYEEMKKDIQAVIKKVAKHIHRDVDDDVIVKVAANLTLEAMKLNYGKTMETRKKLNLTEEPSPLHLFVRKGIAGRWKTEYPEAKWKEMRDTFKEMVKNTIYAKQYFEY
ncbi:sulfotransferase 1 family member D1-like [Apostichopus japonicus]|uniref:sulfotransferase 1 family member D1-like n=1 Tax=Stichopus japonicus TaxID=307972 RepID=UPI003AB634A2